MRVLRSNYLEISVGDTFFRNMIKTKDGLKWIISRGIHVKAWRNSFGSDDEIILIANNLKDIQILALNMCNNISDEGLISISHNLNKLHTLDVSMCNITDFGLISIAENLSNLTSLSFHGCFKISDEAIKSISTNLSQTLRILDLSSCYNLTNIAAVGVSNITSLETLIRNLSGCIKIDDFGIIAIATSLVPVTAVVLHKLLITV